MANSVKLSLIVAQGRNGVIGNAGELPWRLKADMINFRKTTGKSPLVMGRKTWESLPRRPLPGRINVVMTRDWAYKAPGARIYSDLPAALHATKAMAARDGNEEIFVIGGEAIYAHALPFADRLYITEVDAAPEGDAHFPALNASDWVERSSKPYQADEDNDFDFTIRELERA
ncbi:MAG: dihydrofolate reductase [Hyphomonas sp.]